MYDARNYNDDDYDVRINLQLLIFCFLKKEAESVFTIFPLKTPPPLLTAYVLSAFS